MQTVIKKKALNSLYFTANFAYKDKLFLDVTGRNDWSSTLPKSNRSFFYPSVSVSAVMNELFLMPEPINLLKVRGSFAQVGNDTDPYKTSPYYGTSDFPGSAVVASTLYNQDFKPEISTNYEAGFDLRMFQNRIGLDFTFYYNRTKNQILDAPMDRLQVTAKRLSIRDVSATVVMKSNWTLPRYQQRFPLERHFYLV